MRRTRDGGTALRIATAVLRFAKEENETPRRQDAKSGNPLPSGSWRLGAFLSARFLAPIQRRRIHAQDLGRLLFVATHLLKDGGDVAVLERLERQRLLHEAHDGIGIARGA